MKERKNPVNRLTIMTKTGLSLFHRSFQSDHDIDEQLFSGFTSAILGFSKEMGSDLSSINMKGLDLYFQPSDDLVLVLGVDSSYANKSAIEQVFYQISESDKLETIKKSARAGYQKIPTGFENEVLGIIDNLSEESVFDIILDEIQEVGLSELINNYLDGDKKVKDVAVQLIGKDIAQDDATTKSNTTELLSNLLKDSNVDKQTKSKLEDLLEEMKKTSNKAAAKVNRALF